MLRTSLLRFPDPAVVGDVETFATGFFTVRFRVVAMLAPWCEEHAEGGRILRLAPVRSPALTVLSTGTESSKRGSPSEAHRPEELHA